jgi:Arc/MetJ-type ribon-helix-helix transcriptional regulator
MGRTQTMVQLTDQIIETLDREAVRRGVSRSALIREAVAAFLADAHEAEVTRRIVEGYTRVPAGMPDEWGAVEGHGDAATFELLQRLDDEESRQGHGSW